MHFYVYQIIQSLMKTWSLSVLTQPCSQTKNDDFPGKHMTEIISDACCSVTVSTF